MEEIWRDFPGYEGLYQASNGGRIKSPAKVVVEKNGKQKYYKERILTPSTNAYGYYVINLYKNKTKKLWQVSQIIALSFPEICGQWFEGAEIDHISTVRTDNRPENLRWVDRTGNMANPITRKKLTNHPSYSKWVIKLSTQNEILHFYPSANQAERETGIKATNISGCCKRKYGFKTAGGYVWKYAE